MQIVMQGDGLKQYGPTTYDTVPYVSGARAATHPDSVAVLGRLLGLEAAHPNAARVLEIGCGDGGNLLPMAVALPGSDFLGIDLAAAAIQRGQQAIAQVGLRNARLEQRDLVQLGREAGEFDYIVAHGVFSWVPEAVRRALLRVVRETLAPHGLAFVSYNALPGDQVRGVLRGMMRMHTRGISDPARKVQQARALLGLLALAPGDAGDVYQSLLKSEAARANMSSDFFLFHDDLAEVNEPYFFADFIELAREAGLAFASEATFHAMSLHSLPEELAAQLAELGSRDIVAKEQYLDFVTCRGFRQTLLCHREAPIDRRVTLERVAQFRFYSEARRTNPAGAAEAEFTGRDGSVLTTDDPAMAAALELMAARHPWSVTFEELTEHCGLQSPEAAEALAEMLFMGFSMGLVGFRLYEPQAVPVVSERPVASPWARYRAETGRAANLFHETIALSESQRRLLPLLDGGKTLDEAARQLGLDPAQVGGDAAALALSGLLIG